MPKAARKAPSSPTGYSLRPSRVTGRLFGLTYTQVEVPVWHPDVLAYDVARSDDGAAVGRIYLDLHPRRSCSKKSWSG